jgi:hypothetical protein
MSTVVVLTPIIIANWPAISATIVAAVSSMGYAAARNAVENSAQNVNETNKTEIEVENSDILQGAAGTNEVITVEKEGIRAVFSRDARGSLRLCMEGKGYSDAELRRIGQELTDRVTQQYVYHRVVSELKQRNMTIVDEEVKEDRTVKIRIRNS